MAGGLLKGIKRAREMGVECMQIFAGSPRRYEVFLPPEKEISKYKEAVQETGISPVYIHGSYLLNLASEDKEIARKSVESLKKSLGFADAIKAEGVVYHPGSPKGGPKDKAIEREIESISRVLAGTSENSFLIVENTAGEKKIGTGPEEVGYILKKVGSSRLKVCLDTAHSFEAGDIVSFEEKEIKRWLLKWEKEVQRENIVLFHINDSATKSESQHDRHENIGSGHIGRKGFENLMRIEKTWKIPWVLEVPGFENRGPDKKNVDILKEIRRKCIVNTMG